MSQYSVQSEVSSNLKKLVRRLKSIDESEFITRKLYEPSTLLLKVPGKLLRPMLVFTGSKIVDNDTRLSKFIDLAAAIELLHVSSLVHDDIIDRSTTRRGIKAVHVKYGLNSALLAGDALISKAIQLAAKYGNKVINKIAYTAMEMCAGEMLDTALRNNATENAYLRVAELKSASLIGTSFSIAAVYAKSNMANALYRIGHNFGIAFQIRDDVLDFLEGEEQDGVKSTNIVSIIRKHRSSTKEAVERAIQLNNKFIDIAEKEASALQKNKGIGLFMQYSQFVRLPNDYA